MASPGKRREKGSKHREAMARRSREQTSAVSDVGQIPPVADPARREACRLDLLRFLTTYFPNSTGLSPFSADHERVIAREQHCILSGGRFVNAVYRGFAKTTIGENTAIWAVLYGHRRFVVLFGSDGGSADESMESIQMELEGNDLLYADFPEVCHPVRHLEGKPQRAAAQHCGGERTYIEWTAQRIVLPQIKGSKAAGAVIVTRGITAGFRGLKKKLPDGTQPRPDVIVGDDVQTDETASTSLQVSKTLAIFRKGIARLGSHRKQLAIVVNATVIQQGDAIDQLLADPAWQGERIPLVVSWPETHKTLWLERYAALRRDYDPRVVDSQHAAWARATTFYREHRAEMDAGGVVSWEGCYDPEHEISALQHACNILIDDGEEAFASECQQRPLPKIPAQPGDLTADAIAARVNRCPRGVVPPGMTRTTAFVDVQADLLFWLVAAWSEGFGGAVVDYGAWPDQGRGYFALADARPTLRDATGVGTLEGSLYAGLSRLADAVLGRDWPVHGGGVLKVERCLVDSGWGLSTETVYRWCRQTPHAAVVLPSKGMGISASMNPIAEWPKKPGERRGDNWVIPVPAPGQGRRALYDANAYKSFVAARLRQPMGEPGCLTLFGEDAAAHRLFADHCTGEYRVETTGRGRTLTEWKIKPHRPDQHWWDCICGAAVAASILGLQPAGVPRERPKERRRVSYAQQQQERRAGR